MTGSPRPRTSKLPSGRRRRRWPPSSRTGLRGHLRARRICSRVYFPLACGDVIVFPPVGLHEHGVDLVEPDGGDAVVEGLVHGGYAEIARAADDALGGADYQVDRLVAERAVGERGAVELGEDEGPDILGGEPRHGYGVGDAAANVLVGAEAQLVEQRVLGDEDEVVAFREVLQQQPQPAQAFDVHEMGVVDYGYEHLAVAVDLPGGLDEHLLAAGDPGPDIDPEGLAEYLEGVGIGVQRPRDDGGEHAFGVVAGERPLEDALAGAGFAHDEAEPALLRVHQEGVEDLLLVGQQVRLLFVEGVAFESEVCAYCHCISPFWLLVSVRLFAAGGGRSLARKSTSRASP